MEVEAIRASQKKKKPNAPPVAVITVLSSDEEEEELPKKATKHTSKANIEVGTVRLMKSQSRNDSLYPEATDAAPVWDFYHPSTKMWTKFEGALPKMIEGLSKRSAVFTINVPTLGGYQVTLATMRMNHPTEERSSTAIRRTPPLQATRASPVLAQETTQLNGSASSSSSASLKKKKGKNSEDHSSSKPNHSLFAVDADTVARCKKATGWKVISADSLHEEDATSSCVICCDSFDDERTIVRLSRCGKHYFHENCIAASFKPGFISCPVCQTIYGVRTGTQPRGTMNTSKSSTRLSGYEKYGCITVTYNFQSGTQESCHPNPGAPYHGTSRTAYLPDCPEGQKVLKLLELAFERKLVFTIGTSVTTGQSDCVIWNGIHHKTSQTGGSSNFGYPDPTYLERVTDELNSRGVTL